MVFIQGGAFIPLASFWRVHGFVSGFIKLTSRIPKVTFKRLEREKLLKWRGKTGFGGRGRQEKNLTKTLNRGSHTQSSMRVITSQEEEEDLKGKVSEEVAERERQTDQEIQREQKALVKQEVTSEEHFRCAKPYYVTSEVWLLAILKSHKK